MGFDYFQGIALFEVVGSLKQYFTLIDKSWE